MELAGSARRDGRCAVQIEARLDRIVIGELDLGRQRDVPAMKGIERSAGAHVLASLREEPHRLVSERAVERSAIGDDELLALVALLEVVIEPLALHPSRNEGEIALVVLANVIDGLVDAVQSELVIGRNESSALQDLLEDLNERVADEDAAVVREREVPELRDDRRAEEAVASRFVQVLEGGDHSVEGEVGLRVHRERHAIADHFGELELFVARDEQVHFERVERRQPFASAEARHAGRPREDCGSDAEMIPHSQMGEQALHQRNSLCFGSNLALDGLLGIRRRIFLDPSVARRAIGGEKARLPAANGPLCS